MSSSSDSYSTGETETEEESDINEYPSSNKRLKSATISGVDRLGALPDPILHHILSFMDMKEVITTVNLSRRWKSLWKFVPVLNFDPSCSSSWLRRHRGQRQDKDDLLQRFVKFVDRVLLHHECPRIQRVCLETSREVDFDNWMKAVLRRDVQELHLHYQPGTGKTAPLPDYIFTSGITGFKLITRPYCAMIPKSLWLAPQLQTLELYESRLLKSNKCGEVTVRTPHLESVKLRNCDYSFIGTLRISAPLLRNLEITESAWCNDCKLKISAKNLISLVLKGLDFNKYSLKNLCSLVSARVEFAQPVSYRILSKLLNGLYNVTTLQLSGQSVIETADMLDQQLIPFQNLRSLKLAGFSVDIVHNLLTSSPSLETLVVGINQVVSKGKDLAELSLCVSRLKSIEIQGVEGRDNELEFFEFVFKTAAILEAFTVTTNDVFLRNPWEEQATFNMKMHSFTKASSRVKILFRSIIPSSAKTRDGSRIFP